jgi:hypothetical protein
MDSHGLKVVERVGNLRSLPRFGVMRLDIACNRRPHLFKLRGAKGICLCYHGKLFEIMRLR